MVAQTDVKSHLDGVLSIMSIAASAIDLGFLSDRVVQLTQAQQATVFVVESRNDHPEQKTLSFVQGKQETQMPLTDSSMAGAVILANDLINIADCSQDDRFSYESRQVGLQAKQMLCVPVVALSGETIGAIQLINTETGIAFADKDIEMIRELRGYIEIAIINKQLNAK